MESFGPFIPDQKAIAIPENVSVCFSVEYSAYENSVSTKMFRPETTKCSEWEHFVSMLSYLKMRFHHSYLSESTGFREAALIVCVLAVMMAMMIATADATR